MEKQSRSARIAIGLRGVMFPIVRRLQALSFDDDLSLPQATVLSLLDRGGPTTAAALAARERIRPQSMAAIVGPLIKQGYIRQSSDAEDGRKLLLTITVSGRQVMENERSEIVRVIEAAIREHYSIEDQKLLLEVMPLLERLGSLV